jgi:DNA topoisomerase II
MDSDSDVLMSERESDFSDEGFSDGEDENMVLAPSSKVVKTKKATQASCMVLSNKDSNVSNVAATNNGKQTKTVEEIYQKKTQLEHILLRPDTYIGSVERHTQTMFVLDNDRIVEREISYTPGLFKIFDEIVVNAADNKQRDLNMDRMDITIDAATNLISVRNNGKGIPIVMHKEHKVYVPTMIFGHLLTGSNFDDTEKKTTGGRNGYGAKLANVFSLEFVVECVDIENGLKFQQTFRNNMTVKEDPIVKKCSAVEKKQGDYVKISFSPDLRRFGMTELDKDTVGLLSKRAYDIAGTMAQSNGKKLSVSLNGNKLPIKSFKDYLELFDGINAPVAYEKVSDLFVAIVLVAFRPLDTHH